MLMFNPFSVQKLVATFTFYGGGKGDGGDAPDYSQIAAANKYAAEASERIADKDMAFRERVYNESLPRQNQLYDLASQVAQQQLNLGRLTEDQARQQLDSYNATYRPIELQSVLDSLGTQYLDDVDVQQAIKYLTDPKYDTTTLRATRQVPYTENAPETTTSTSVTDGYTSAGPWNPITGGYSGAGPWNPTTGAQTGTVPTKTTTTTTSTKNTPVTKYRTEEYDAGVSKVLNKDFEAQRAAYIDSLAKKAQNNAATQAGTRATAQANSMNAQQMRTLARMGLNPARFQAVAAAQAQNNALAAAGAENQARQQVTNQQLGLRTGVSNFGRNMPNTVGQAVAGATNAGSSAVGNQNTGFQSGLPYANFMAGGYQTGLAAQQLRQQGALGLGQLMSNDYRTSMSNQGDDFLGGALGLAGSLGSAYIMRGGLR